MTPSLTIPTYEQWLGAEAMRALREGGMHFENQSAVHKTLQKFVKRLDELNIPYALGGAMGMFLQGYRRFTEDVDILVTPEDLTKIHEHLDGLGYVPLRAGGKNLRDAEYGVKIEFLKSGDYPGDGKPKPVVFPTPQECGQVIDGVRCIRLPKLVELKLASGMAPGRRKDLGDVQEMIRVLGLPREFAASLNPYVQDLYAQLWNEVEQTPSDP